MLKRFNGVAGKNTNTNCQKEIFMPQVLKVDDRARDQVRRQAQSLRGFDYSAPAELFPSRNQKCRTKARYRRFDTAAEAVRFVVEGIPPSALLGAYLVVEDERFGLDDIHHFYESAAFPLERAATKKKRRTAGPEGDSLHDG
jgi:hypothetical protein